jgi:flagellar basal-body rod protein FlgF
MAENRGLSEWHDSCMSRYVEWPHWAMTLTAKTKRNMENTLFIGLSRQLVAKREMDVIANNLANASSPGYKGEQMMFAEEVKAVNRSTRLSFVRDVAVARNYGEGEIRRTNNTLDVAIKGQGWFEVEAGGSLKYTRNGHFELDREGQLVNTSGQTIQSEKDGPIVFAPGDLNIVIKSDGTVTANGEDRGKIKVVSFDDMRSLKKVSGNLYTSGAQPQKATDFSMVQGMLEKSNVQPIMEVTRMIDTLRGYQSTQKLLEQEHDRQRKAIEKLTRET